LECDGVAIEDDEDLLVFSKEDLMILEDEQAWQPVATVPANHVVIS
jgi:hypothetical protein